MKFFFDDVLWELLVLEEELYVNVCVVMFVVSEMFCLLIEFEVVRNLEF